MPLEHFAEITPPPDASLWIGGVGCGKTHAVIEEIQYARASGSGFRPIWVLLASGVQVSSFRQRLLDTNSEGVLFGVEFFNFEALYKRVLDRAGDPQHAINGTARTHVLRRVIERLSAEGRLELFGPIAGTPGFVAWVGRLVSELKQGLVSPETYLNAAAGRGPKDRDLALIYDAYQSFLRERRLVDSHGAGWLALEHVRNGSARTDDVQLLVVDGFDQFNRLHVELLTALARTVERTIVTLTQTNDARAPRFRRFAETRDRLMESGRDLWPMKSIPGEGCGRAEPLQHLIDTVFDLSPQRGTAGDAVELIEAPDVEREVSAVLRRVKRRLLDGTPPDAIAIVARDLSRYGGALRATARAYGVPLVVRRELPLRENPALAALLALIDLAALDFPRRAVLDVLRSPYLAPPGLDPAAVAALAAISHEQQVVRGRKTWLDAVRSSVRPPEDEDGDSRDEPLAERATLADALEAWFERVTPPASGTLDDLLRWIEALAGPDPEAEREARAEGEVDLPLPVDPRDHMNLLAQVRAAHDGEQVTRDLLALRGFREVLAGMRAARMLIDGATGAPMPWETFRRELELALAHATVMPPGGMSRVGRVLATDVLEARGLPHEHVYLLGLAEGLFPAPQSHADLHHEGERIELAAAGIALRSPAERADDFSLFYQAIGLARQTLTLSRFTVDDAGAPVPPSPFWNSVLRVLDVPPEQRERIPLGAAPPLEHAATPGEVAVAAATLLASGSGESQRALAAHNALLGDPAWRNVLRGRLIEARREDPGIPFDRTMGRLRDPALVGFAAQILDGDRLWSATQLNDLGQCPFRFFARRLLHLEELKEPEEGYDALQLGSIYHAILERTYRAVQREGLAIMTDNLPRALDLLETIAASVLADAPERYGFRPSAVWPHEQATLLKRLRWLVEQDFSGDGPIDSTFGEGAPRIPYALEAAFGMGGGEPVAIDGPAGTLWIRGKIDRLDRAGDAIVVIDYKSGGDKITDDDLREARNVQMLVYLLAADRILAENDEQAQVIGGLYWYISDRKPGGVVAGQAGSDALAQASAALHRHVEQARDGRFVVMPGKPMVGRKCAYHWCDFRTMCRLTRPGRRKSFEETDA